jgi:hypothetical protein
MAPFIARIISFFLIPGLLISYGSNKIPIPIIDNLFKEDVTRDSAKWFFFIAGTILAVVIVPTIKELDSRRLKGYLESNKTLLESFRKSVSSELARHLLTRQQVKDRTDLKLNIRIFLPRKRSSFQPIRNFGKKYFVVKDYPGLNVRSIDKIQFLVFPDNMKQGLVGQVYSEKNVKFDFNVNQNQSTNVYNLTPNQLNVTHYCKFAIAAPIFKPMSENEIEAIVCFDSEVGVSQPTNDDWQAEIRKSCKIIHQIHKSLK